MQKLLIYILGGGISREREVSLKTAKTLLTNIDKTKYEPVMIIINNDDIWRDRLIKNKPDVVLLGLHGTGYEDGQIQEWLDKQKIKYTGSGAKASKFAFDKQKSKEIFVKEGLQVPRGIVIEKKQVKEVNKLINGLKYPFFVKPNQNGSSVATTRIKDSNELAKALYEVWALDKGALVEEEINGRELSCGVVQNGDAPLVLPVTEIKPRNDFFSYKAKYSSPEQGGAEEITPAELSQEITNQVKAIASICHECLGCKGITRTDIILTPKNELFVLEINTLPGMTETSLVPQQAKANGLTISNLIDLLIEGALNNNI